MVIFHGVYLKSEQLVWHRGGLTVPKKLFLMRIKVA